MDRFVLATFVLCTAIAVVGAVRPPTLMKFQDNGYENILVAIHHNVSENPDIIDEIKQMFTDASPYLYTATKKRAFFRNVSILIPETWKDKPEYEKAVLESFERADMRVDIPNPVNGDVPYVKQPGGCGEPGEYIHVTPDFMLDKKGNRMTNYGDLGRILVHEFAHLRYGVFDEYGFPEHDEFPLFYVSSRGRPQVTGCAERVRGSYQVNGHNVDEARRCRRDRATGLPEKGCKFYPLLDRNPAKTSIMFYQFINNVQSFCENDHADIYQRHNALAPNKQNKMCNGRGTWDVIKEHSDFIGVDGQVKEIPDVEPSFRLLYPRRTVDATGVELDGKRLVLVLDVSDSMNKKDRVFKLLQTATSFIRDNVPLGIEVGMVAFNNHAYTSDTYPQLRLRVLKSAADKEAMVRDIAHIVPALVGGSTAIGKALQAAKKVLSKDGRSLMNARIVLITDGTEMVRPLMMDVLPEFEGTGVVINTIAYSIESDRKLSHVSKKTGGRSFYYSEDQLSTAFDGALTESVSGMGDETKDPVELLRTALLLEKLNEEYRGLVTIDDTVGLDTKFVFMYPKNGSVEATITSPSGVRYTSQSKEYVKYDSISTIHFNIQNAEHGDWLFYIKHTCNVNKTQAVVVKVHSHAPEYTKPVTVKAWIDKVNLHYPMTTVLYADVRRGYMPVIGVNVTATIERPRGGKVTLQLFDNGAGADNEKNDGIYSVYFTTFSGNDRYSVDVQVHTVAGQGQYKSGGGSGVAPKTGDFKPVVKTPAPKLNRVATAGVFMVQGWKSGVDPYAPCRVVDLRLVSYSDEDNVVVLEWTEPGEDLDHGTVLKYDLRIAQSSEELADNFEMCDLANISKPITPVKAGNTIRVLIDVTGYNNTLMTFGVRAIDHSGQHNNVSNIVFAAYVEPEELDEGLSAGVIAGIVVASVVVAFGIAATVGLIIKTKLTASAASKVGTAALP